MKTTDNQNELFIVVDKNDKVLGYKTRYDCHRNPGLIHRVIGVLVFNSQKDVLLQKRSKTKDIDAGLWGTSCAGHVIKGQSYKKAAERELYEELGIRMPLIYITKYMEQGKNETEMAVLYKTFYDGPFQINQEETDEVKFYNQAELRNLIAKNRLKLSLGCILSLKHAGVLS